MQKRATGWSILPNTSGCWKRCGEFGMVVILLAVKGEAILVRLNSPVVA